ncbi:site-specific tyrosine recombinase/integron integrase [Methanogenium sp. MK-MG]|uniref:site-specific tyrosine recombinase/integron integrase n=1 Tax=Methanogenium sp. MK-MG TaxID=2599926 RepID=UPI0013EAF80F|nr:site-specific tyrosine recombinase/integron integrase [Methanogenium sp. MK-MG]KAF1078602.1 Tyrosine recombinase XerC [Methanogenium sp. MK-MG]
MQGDYFSEWLPRFLHHLRMRNYSPGTITSYGRVIRKFGYYLWICRNKGVGKLEAHWHDPANGCLDTGVNTTPIIIDDYLAFLMSLRDYKATTLHRIISSLSSFYRYLYTQGIVESNPLPAVGRPRIKEKELKYLKHNQMMRLLGSIPDTDFRDRLIIRLIYATGVRVSELCGMTLSDIDFDDYTIRVLGKGGKVRIVFVDDDTLEEIQKFTEGRIDGPLFVGQMGHAISPRTVQHLFRKWAPKGITPHKIRHSYASELYRRSKNLRVVQENLGHSSIQTTEIYLHTDVDERRDVYQQYFPLSRHD